MKQWMVTGLAVVVLLGGCEKATPATWQRISNEAPCQSAPTEPGPAGKAAPCTPRVYFLDVAHITPKAGLVYVTMQTRIEGDTSGDYGISHAEANCRSGQLEPTALQEDRFHRDGQKIGMQLTPISAEDEAAIVGLACKGVAQ
jgi:hypothetical protein